MKEDREYEIGPTKKLTLKIQHANKIKPDNVRRKAELLCLPLEKTGSDRKHTGYMLKET